MSSPGALARRVREVGVRRLWRTAMCWLPVPVTYELWHRAMPARLRVQLDTATDVHLLDIDGGQLALYWSDVPDVGSGPSASLYVLDDIEVLRLDCFGDDLGHMHINPTEQELTGRLRGVSARIYFPEGTRSDHVDRAAFELARNVTAAMRMHPLRRVQTATIDADALAAAAADMVDVMGTMLARRESIS